MMINTQRMNEAKIETQSQMAKVMEKAGKVDINSPYAPNKRIRYRTALEKDKNTVQKEKGAVEGGGGGGMFTSFAERSSREEDFPGQMAGARVLFSSNVVEGTSLVSIADADSHHPLSRRSYEQLIDHVMDLLAESNVPLPGGRGRVVDGAFDGNGTTSWSEWPGEPGAPRLGDRPWRGVDVQAATDHVDDTAGAMIQLREASAKPTAGDNRRRRVVDPDPHPPDTGGAKNVTIPPIAALLEKNAEGAEKKAEEVAHAFRKSTRLSVDSAMDELWSFVPQSLKKRDPDLAFFMDLFRKFVVPLGAIKNEATHLEEAPECAMVFQRAFGKSSQLSHSHGRQMILDAVAELSRLPPQMRTALVDKDTNEESKAKTKKAIGILSSLLHEMVSIVLLRLGPAWKYQIFKFTLNSAGTPFCHAYKLFKFTHNPLRV